MDDPAGPVFSSVLANGSSNVTCSRDNMLKVMVFPVLYSLLFLLGLSLNALAVWVFFNIPSRSHFIIYLKNIVVADVVMTLTFPFKILADSNLVSVGMRVFVCRFSSVFFYLTMYISILFFGLISVDRCRKTLSPFVGTNATKLRNRKFLAAGIWASLLALSIPNMVLTSHTPASVHFKCSDLKTKFGLLWHEVVNHICQVIFWGNLVTVVVCYTLITRELYNSYARTRAMGTKIHTRVGTVQGPPGTSSGAAGGKRKKSVRANVFLVLAVFFICFVPFHFVRVPYTMSQTHGRLFDCHQKLVFYKLKESTLWLSSLNSLLDPLIYFFLCKSFRTSLFSTLRLAPGRCRRLRELGTDTNTNMVNPQESTGPL